MLSHARTRIVQGLYDAVLAPEPWPRALEPVAVERRADLVRALSASGF